MHLQYMVHRVIARAVDADAPGRCVGLVMTLDTPCRVGAISPPLEGHGLTPGDAFGVAMFPEISLKSS